MRDFAAQNLLEWYDRHARDLPWRVAPTRLAQGERPDPYRVWLSEIMLQQTTVAAVKSYYERFTSLWPSVTDLANAEDADVMGEWAGLGYYARARNLLKCARVVAFEHHGVFPMTRDGLQELPGIGPYTAAAISAIAYDAPEVVVDGNVERVMARLFDLGATSCTPRNPACGICPLQSPCGARAEGVQAELPKKTPKKPKPTRLGIAYVARRTDGAWLLEQRPDKGLLGGMLGWPGSEWNDAPEPLPPTDAAWQALGEEARHTFTHFHLRLALRTATVSAGLEPDRGQFVPHASFRPADLPTVMRKAFDLAAPVIAGNCAPRAIHVSSR